MKKGILFVINELRPGGAEMFLLRLAHYLESDFEIHIYCLFPATNDEAFVNLLKSKVKFKFLPPFQGRLSDLRTNTYWKLNAIGILFKKKGIFTKLVERDKRIYFRKEIIKRKIRVINTSGISSDNFAVNYLNKYFKIPVLLTMHSDYNQEFWDVEGRSKDVFLKLAESIFTNSAVIAYTADHNINVFKELINYKGIKPEKCYLGHTPTAPKSNRMELGIGEDAFVIVMMARGIIEKGWVEAIKAFTILQMQNANSYLLLISTETEHIQKLKEENEENSHIIFKGYQAEPSTFLHSSDCMIFPSHFPESLPYAITEALACGKPVFACPIAEIPLMLETEEGIAGELIPLTNEGVADHFFLAEKLIELANDLQLLTRKQVLAEKAFAKFSMEKCGEFYKEKLLDIMKK
jgi:glycosyltransferase involved in cell wall biosynthesis